VLSLFPAIAREMSKLTGTFSDTDREVHFLKAPVGIDRECYLMFVIGKGGSKAPNDPGSACEMRLAQKHMNCRGTTLLSEPPYFIAVTR
jgi:hypothetical protein